ncbi:MAG: polysaccharide biosynthesis protein [Lachnospiraceae bacterium]|jgi:stage V sporulation protein B|nr:polysaccharide biosynthesis protein [Lachnospiraceae bacterium]
MSAKKRNNHFLVQGSILAAASLIVRMIGLLYRIPLTHIIGDEGMGIYTHAYALYNLALILSSYSVPLAVSKLVATRTAFKEHRNAYRIFLCAMVFSIAVGLIATLIIFFGADFFAVVISNNPKVALPLRILAPTILVFSIMGVFRGFYQGKNTMIPTAISQILEQIVNAVVSIVASYLLMKNYSASVNVAAYGAAGGTLGTFIGAFVGLLFLVFVFVIYKPVLNKQMRKDSESTRESYKSIYKLIIITILPVVLSQTVYHVSGVIDNSMFGHLMEGKEIALFDYEVLKNSETGLYSKDNTLTLIGIYGSKYLTLSNVPVAIASAIAAAIVTSISAAHAKGYVEEIRNKVSAAIKFNMIIAIPSAVGMGVLASPILRLLFRDSYQLSANFMRLGSIAIVFYALSTVSTSILQGIGKLKIPVINSAISLGIHVVLIYVLLEFTPLSTYALVIGNVIFALVVSILNWFSLEKYLNYRQEIVKTFIIPTVSAGLMGVAAYFICNGFMKWTGSILIPILITIPVSILLYFSLLILMKGLEEHEIAQIPKGEVMIRILRKMHLL